LVNTPTPTPPPSCTVTGPTNPSVSDIETYSAILHWNPGSGGVEQRVRVGNDEAEVSSGCPNGVVPAAGATCVVKDTIMTSTSSYGLPALSPGITYYWDVIEYKDSNDWWDFNPTACLTKGNIQSFTTVCIVSMDDMDIISGTTSSINPSIDGDVDEVTFALTDVNGTDVASVCSSENPSCSCSPASKTYTDDDPSNGLNAHVTACGDPGNEATLDITGLIDPDGTRGNGDDVTCENGSAVNVTVNIIDAGPWWQAKEGDIISGTSISSMIATTACNTEYGGGEHPECYLINYDTGEYPGIAQFGEGLTPLSPSFNYEWNANSPYSGLDPAGGIYDFLYNKIKYDVTPADVAYDALGTAINPNDAFNNGGSKFGSSDYYFYKLDGGDGNEICLEEAINMEGEYPSLSLDNMPIGLLVH
jgi:hypothetical protein